METPPAAFPGETFLHTYRDSKFFLGQPATWPSFSSFHGHGTIHLSTCRLLFALDPPTGHNTSISIPLHWVKRERLHIRRPFFDSKHVSGVIVPADVSNMPLGLFSQHKTMNFRIEMLDPSVNDEICLVLKELLADSESVARYTRVLRDAVDGTLIPTNTHFAFVDPRNTCWLYLSTQMKPPR